MAHFKIEMDRYIFEKMSKKEYTAATIAIIIAFAIFVADSRRVNQDKYNPYVLGAGYVGVCVFAFYALITAARKPTLASGAAYFLGLACTAQAIGYATMSAVNVIAIAEGSDDIRALFDVKLSGVPANPSIASASLGALAMVPIMLAYDLMRWIARRVNPQQNTEQSLEELFH
jgi:hypothetical protein